MDKDTILVVTGDTVATRGGGVKPLKVDELSVNINLFIEQMGNLLEKTPEKLGKFHFEEFEVYAEVTGKGTLAILGTGGELGATGGLRFVFRRSTASSDGK
jgi:hypothetical protein